MTSKDYNKIITSIYLKYNPNKVSEVQNLIDKYKGYEEELLQSIINKYKVTENEINLILDNNKKDTNYAFEKTHFSSSYLIYSLLVIVLLLITGNFIYQKFDIKKENDITTDTSITKTINTQKLIPKEYETLDLLDLIKLREEPNNTKLIKNKGYQYLETRNEEKYYVSNMNDTISIYYGNVTWSGGIKNKSLFNHLHEQAQNTSALTYDKEYSYDLIGDEPSTPIYRNNFTYFNEDGTEHSAIIFYSDDSKLKPKKYIFYIGDSE
jgi:hypothetical protein